MFSWCFRTESIFNLEGCVQMPRSRFLVAVSLTKMKNDYIQMNRTDWQIPMTTLERLASLELDRLQSRRKIQNCDWKWSDFHGMVAFCDLAKMWKAVVQLRLLGLLVCTSGKQISIVWSSFLQKNSLLFKWKMRTTFSALSVVFLGRKCWGKCRNFRQNQQTLPWVQDDRIVKQTPN